MMTWEGGDKPKIVTNDDMGGRGVKKSHFCGDVLNISVAARPISALKCVTFTITKKVKLSAGTLRTLKESSYGRPSRTKASRSKATIFSLHFERYPVPQ